MNWGERIRMAYGRLTEHLTSGFHYESVEKLVRRLVYFWCLLCVAIMLPVAGKVWGPDAPIVPIAELREYRALFGLDVLSKPEVAPHYICFLAVYVISLFGGLFDVMPKASAVLVFIIYQMLSMKAHMITDGGDTLMSQFLFYLTLSQCLSGSNGSAGNVVRNLCFSSMRIQLCVMYATSALVKFGGELWPRGQALYYVLHTDEYTLPWVRDLVGSNHVLLALATFTVLLFQLSFPILIWRDSTRRPMMFLGSLIHLQIALVMGLFSFGLAMILSYTVFYTNEEAVALAAVWRKRLGRRWLPRRVDEP